jgi:tetratricopeptide (TPR) repeat protein
LDHLQYFQDRKEAIAAFDALWDHPSPWILAYTGFSGHGKSTMLDWLVVNRCLPQKIPYSLIGLGEKSGDIGEALNILLESADGTLQANLSSMAFERYRSRRLFALEERNRRHLSLTHTLVMDASPGSQQTLNADLAKALQELNRQSAQMIAEAWLDCLSSLPSRSPLVFLFDNYDVFQESASLEDIRFLWTMLERLLQRLPGLRIIVASREPLRYQYDIRSIQNGLSSNDLIVLNPHDSDALLVSMGVAAAAFRQSVFTRLAHGHPLLTRMAGEAWLATPKGIPASQVPLLVSREQAVEWVQGRILDRLSGPLKQAVRWAALLRWFHADSLSAILESGLSQDDFDALTRYAFIIHPRLAPDYWACHDLVRRVQFAYLQRQHPDTFIEFHKRAFTYFTECKQPLDALYHQFFVDPQKSIENWMKLESHAAFEYDHPLWAALMDIALAPEISLSDKSRADVLLRSGRRQRFRDENEEALTIYGQALELFGAVGDRLGEANTLQAIGDVQRFRDENEEALTSYAQALELFRAVGSRLGEANTLKAIGDVQSFRKENEEALTSYDQALELYRAVGDRLGEANTLRAIGDVQSFRKENEEALTSYGQALELFGAVGDRLGEANTLQAIGEVQSFRKENEEALTSYAKALELYRGVGDRLGEANTLQAIGDVQSFRKENEEALTSYAQALELYRVVGDRLGEANTLQAIGDVQSFRAENEEALTSYAQALELYRAVGDRLGEANTLQAIGDVQRFRAENEEALTSYAQALELYRAVGARLGEANTLKAIGQFLLSSDLEDQQHEGFQSLQAALNLYRQVGDRVGQANIALTSAKWHSQKGELSKALPFAEEAYHLGQQIAPGHPVTLSIGQLVESLRSALDQAASQ